MYKIKHLFRPVFDKIPWHGGLGLLPKNEARFKFAYNLNGLLLSFQKIVIVEFG